MEPRPVPAVFSSRLAFGPRRVGRLRDPCDGQANEVAVTIYTAVWLASDLWLIDRT